MDKRYENLTNYFYILKIGGDTDIIKVGITCNLTRRLQHLHECNRRRYKVHKLIPFNTRTEALSFEQYILGKYKELKRLKSWIKDGKREHLSIESLPDLESELRSYGDRMFGKVLNPFLDIDKVSSTFVTPYTGFFVERKPVGLNKKPRKLTRNQFRFVKVLFLELKFCHENDIETLRMPLDYLLEYFTIGEGFFRTLKEHSSRGSYSVPRLISDIGLDIERIPSVTRNHRQLKREYLKYDCSVISLLYSQESKYQGVD